VLRHLKGHSAVVFKKEVWLRKALWETTIQQLDQKELCDKHDNCDGFLPYFMDNQHVRFT